MSQDISGKKVAIFGLAKSGIAACHLCLRKGAKVIGIDRRSSSELGETASSLEKAGVELALGPHDDRLLLGVDLVVVSPGVPLALPQIKAAKEAGVKVIAEVELASWYLTGTFIGITGTNGKSTVTSLTAALCETAGLKTFSGGNLGRPLSEAAIAEIDGNRFETIVCELSSFQLEGIETLKPRVACVTNLTPDHIDRYPSHEAYGAAKKRIFMNQGATDFGVVNARDAATIKMVEDEKCRASAFCFGKTFASSTGNVQGSLGAYWDGEAIYLKAGATNRSVTDSAHPDGEVERYLIRNRALRGNHNIENAMSSLLCARLSGASAEKMQTGLDNFPGLAHRIEYSGTVNGVEYINDSKATNVDSTIVGLSAFNKGVWLIAGGRGKGAPYAPMVELSKGRVKAVLTIGEDAHAIEAAYRGSPNIEIIPCQDLEAAVRVAYQRTSPGDVVLLSPACASFDQFKNFEERGDCFKKLVKKLHGFSVSVK